MFTFALVVALILGFYFFTDWFSKVTGYFTGDDQMTRLATCLTKEGSEFYTGSCAECEKQEKLFGQQTLGLLIVVDCSRATESCSNLRSLPAWYINDSIQYGFKSLDDLKALSRC